MDNESKFPAVPRRSIGMMLLVLASLGLNVFLAKHLLQRRPASSLPPATAMQGREQSATAPATSAPAY